MDSVEHEGLLVTDSRRVGACGVEVEASLRMRVDDHKAVGALAVRVWSRVCVRERVRL